MPGATAELHTRPLHQLAEWGPLNPDLYALSPPPPRGRSPHRIQTLTRSATASAHPAPSRVHSSSRAESAGYSDMRKRGAYDVQGRSLRRGGDTGTKVAQRKTLAIRPPAARSPMDPARVPASAVQDRPLLPPFPSPGRASLSLSVNTPSTPSTPRQQDPCRSTRQPHAHCASYSPASRTWPHPTDPDATCARLPPHSFRSRVVTSPTNPDVDAAPFPAPISLDPLHQSGPGRARASRHIHSGVLLAEEEEECTYGCACMRSTAPDARRAPQEDAGDVGRAVPVEEGARGRSLRSVLATVQSSPQASSPTGVVVAVVVVGYPQHAVRAPGSLEDKAGFPAGAYAAFHAGIHSISTDSASAGPVFPGRWTPRRVAVILARRETGAAGGPAEGRARARAEPDDGSRMVFW
ncbi:hypothetical protein C8R44DRAFT_876974 [Mycena epipterygia]|nr:hypothetical protein C8R44DRAFT_876974 [Mycena epipterygia]